jgi:hypothetical protein
LNKLPPLKEGLRIKFQPIVKVNEKWESRIGQIFKVTKVGDHIFCIKDAKGGIFPVCNSEFTTTHFIMMGNEQLEFDFNE